MGALAMRLRSGEPGTAPTRPGSAGAALDLLDAARQSLLQACQSAEASQRYQHAQLAALRAAAALVVARERRTRRAARGGRSGSVWDLLPVLAPELGEWAQFFALCAARVPGLAQGTGRVSAREADDLLRQGETFLDLVCRGLGLPTGLAGGDLLVPVPVAGGGPP